MPLLHQKQMLIPVLCPCDSDLHIKVKRVLRSVLEPLGFSLCFVPCANVEEALATSICTPGVYFEKIPYAVCMPIISAKKVPGEKHRAAKPNCLSPVNYSELHKRETVVLVQKGVELPAGLRGVPGHKVKRGRIITYTNHSLDDALGSLLKHMIKIREDLRARLHEYQLPDIRNDALHYESIDKRVYVYDEGYGLVEMKFQISQTEAQDVYDPETDEYVFRHTISCRLAPTGQSKDEFESSLESMRIESLKEFFELHDEQFMVVPFGFPPPSVTFRASNENGDKSSKTIEIRVKLSEHDSRSRSGTISYAIGWGAKELFRIDNDETAFMCAHYYNRVSYSLCFIRRTLEHGWDFAEGPLLERFGPYQNDLGYIDSEGVGDEHFHYKMFPWYERRLSPGCVLRVRWSLKPEDSG